LAGLRSERELQTMTKPPPADGIPGKIKPRPAKGEKMDRPLERIRRGMPPVAETKGPPRK
jgi:hypothetical protein